MSSSNFRFINIPDFLIRQVDTKDITKLKKTKLVLKGKLFILVFKYLSSPMICRFLSLFYKEGKIIFEDDKYVKVVDGNKYYFPNINRLAGYLQDLELANQIFFDDYCLNKVKFNELKNNIVDCGANIGGLGLSLIDQNIDFNYISFEPDSKAFDCLSLNLEFENTTNYNVALSDHSIEKNFFLDTDGANSSLEYFGEDNFIQLKTKKIDEFNFKDIKLFKIDAEGHELEVLKGAEKTLKIIEYVTVDCGDEKGVNKEGTFVEVSEYLNSKGLKLIAFNNIRQTFLFKNQNIN